MSARSVRQWTRTVSCAQCGTRFARLPGARSQVCLTCVTSARLLTAGIRWADPGLVAIRAINDIARAKAGHADLAAQPRLRKDAA